MINLKFTSQSKNKSIFGSLPIQMRLYQVLEAEGFLADATCSDYIASLKAKAEKVNCSPVFLWGNGTENTVTEKVIVLGSKYEGADIYGYESVRNSKSAEKSELTNSVTRNRSQNRHITKAKDVLPLFSVGVSSPNSSTASSRGI